MKLPTITLDGKRFYVDERLRQIRAVDNPHDFEEIPYELIEYWRANGWLEVKD